MEKQIARVEVQMLIRRPVAEVFNAFIDPGVTTKFWFTKSSGKLEAGKTVTWEWEMYGVKSEVVVVEILDSKKISIDWDNPSTRVDFEFKDMGDGTTYLGIYHHGFTATGDDLISIIKDSTGGFTTVVDGLKVYLEHGINLNLIGDKFPPAAKNHP